MDFSELLDKRRSVRDYEDKEVPMDVINEIISDSIKAPNAGNMQLWRFIIVNNKEQVKRLSDLNKKAIIADIEKNGRVFHIQYFPLSFPVNLSAYLARANKGYSFNVRML